jgi:hypothetical protein
MTIRQISNREKPRLQLNKRIKKGDAFKVSPLKYPGTQMEELIKYFLLAIAVGGAVPIIITYLLKKRPRNNKSPD